MLGTIQLKTERLVLRKHFPEDAVILFRDFGSDEAMYRYSGWNPYASLEMAENTVRKFMERYTDVHFYGWAIEKDGHLSSKQFTQVRFLQLRLCFSGATEAQLFRNQKSVGSNPSETFLYDSNQDHVTDCSRYDRQIHIFTHDLQHNHQRTGCRFRHTIW